MAVFFHQAPRKHFPDKASLKKTISETISENKKTLGQLNYVFLSDSELLEMNQQHLNHDEWTDIITFDLSEESQTIEGDVFISFERIAENAQIHSVSETQEYVRVIGHGLLHLLGLRDKKPGEIKEMRDAENQFIAKFLKWQEKSNHPNLQP